jgi:hypothetical protein
VAERLQDDTQVSGRTDTHGRQSTGLEDDNRVVDHRTDTGRCTVSERAGERCNPGGAGAVGTIEAMKTAQWGMAEDMGRTGMAGKSTSVVASLWDWVYCAQTWLIQSTRGRI